MATSPQRRDGERYLVVRFGDAGHELSCLTPAQLSQRTDSATKTEYRISPIFPVVPGEAKAPSHEDSFFVGFFFFEDPFPIIGELLSIVPKERQHGLWFGHGLASIIFFAEKPNFFEPLKTVSKTALRAFEIWEIKSGKIAIHEQWLAPSAPLKREDFTLKSAEKLSLEIQIIVDELRHCLNTAVSRAAQFLPSGLTTLRQLYPAVNEIIRELENLAAVSDEELKASCLTVEGGYADAGFARQKMRHQLSDQLIQINAALSYVISQAYSGIVPILEHECQIRNYSLLGVGSAHNGLSALTEFCELMFQRFPVDAVVRDKFKTASGLPFLSNLGESIPEWENPSETVDSYIEAIRPEATKLNLAYLSGRLGFRETQFSITAPLQVLTHSGSAKWSLMTLTHELMHAHVRTLLAAIFSFLHTNNPAAEFRTRYEAFEKKLKSNQIPKPGSLLETLQFALLSYCATKPMIEDQVAQIIAGKGTGKGKQLVTLGTAERLTEILSHSLIRAAAAWQMSKMKSGISSKDLNRRGTMFRLTRSSSFLSDAFGPKSHMPVLRVPTRCRFAMSTRIGPKVGSSPDNPTKRTTFDLSIPEYSPPH